MKPALVSCIAPAHNEEALIASTIESLFNQTYQPYEVIIPADNCTDKTVPILRDLQNKYGAYRLIVFETVNNTAKKSGALNQAYERVHPEADFILQMDSDTLLDKHLIEEALIELEQDLGLGGVCSRMGVLPFPGGNWINWILWKLQHIEYGLYDSIRVESFGNVKVLSGAITIFRREALEQVKEHRGGKVWSETSLVEDYGLTLDLKEQGWRGGSGMGMYSFTDTMPTLKMLWKQRKRWYDGTFQELRQRGWTKSTTKDILAFYFFFLMMGFQMLFFVMLGAIIALGIPPEWNALAIGVLAFAWFSKMYRLRYVQNRKWYDVLLIALFFPEEIYTIFRNFIVTICLFKAFFKPTTQW